MITLHLVKQLLAASGWMLFVATPFAWAVVMLMGMGPGARRKRGKEGGHHRSDR